MQCGERHKELDEQGKGLCSVPMWCQGMPAGFCDKEAYGERPPGKEYYSNITHNTHRLDGRFAGYVPYLACPGHGGPTVRICMDGDQFCAAKPDFVNLQESPAGFGDTKEAAIKDLETQNEQP